MSERRQKPHRATRPPAYLTTTELADRWRVTEGHLRNRRVAGRPPRYFSDGGIVRYRIVDIEQHEADHTVTSTTITTGDNTSK